jgi:hypothetical protein
MQAVTITTTVTSLKAAHGDGYAIVIIGSHFVPLESKFLLIALVIVRITIKVFATGGNNIVEVSRV